MMFPLSSFSDLHSEVPTPDVRVSEFWPYSVSRVDVECKRRAATPGEAEARIHSCVAGEKRADQMGSSRAALARQSLA